jgi:glutathione S-transferase
MCAPVDGKQQVLYESLALLHWVDDYYGDKGRELLPGSAARRTKARIIMSRCVYDRECV